MAGRAGPGAGASVRADEFCLGEAYQFVGDFMLLVFTQDGVPTWEVRRRAKLATQAKIRGTIWEPVTPHGMRAGFVTTAYKNGVPDEQIMAHTRHRSLTTMRSYVRRAKLGTAVRRESSGFDGHPSCQMPGGWSQAEATTSDARPRKAPSPFFEETAASMRHAETNSVRTWRVRVAISSNDGVLASRDWA